MKGENQYQQCLEILTWATKQLQVKITIEKLAEIADLIVQSMTGPWRYFHTPNHIFEVGNSQDATEVLAALFHDLVYVQVDHSVNFNLSYYIAPYIQERKGKLKIRDKNELPNDYIFEMVADIFGFVPGQVLLPFSGQNEFMSAIVAAKVMELFLRPKHLFEITACIEATIPFQPILEDGFTVPERLHKRLKETNAKFNLNLNNDELYETVKKTVRLSNRDVIGFGSPSSIFLDNTWNLLPETNHNLTNGNSCIVSEYRIALEKTEGFLNYLNPNFIFRRFDCEPDEQTYYSWIAQAEKNIEIAKIYLGSKIFTLAFIEALSMRLGLNIPMSTMVGEIPSQGCVSAHLEDFLPDIYNPYPCKNNLEYEVLNLFAEGCFKNKNHLMVSSPLSNIRNSRLTTFIVRYLGFYEIKKQRNITNNFCKKKISAEEFIDSCNQNLVKIIIDGILDLFESRKQAISGVKKGEYVNCIIK
ncbi:MAG: hypothetical protein MGF17_00515 [Trichodesmium sp. MAG_R04]|nr:hypothetical protein [Trichodesmium sp. MAG_R04]